MVFLCIFLLFGLFSGCSTIFSGKRIEDPTMMSYLDPSGYTTGLRFEEEEKEGYHNWLGLHYLEKAGNTTIKGSARFIPYYNGADDWVEKRIQNKEWKAWKYSIKKAVNELRSYVHGPILSHVTKAYVLKRDGYSRVKLVIELDYPELNQRINELNYFGSKYTIGGNRKLLVIL